MSEHIITVRYEIRPERMDDFIELIKENSKKSLDEPGCLNYEASMAGNKVFLYEKYKSEDDFKYHTTTDHYKNYAEKIKDLVLNKEVIMYKGIK